ncbi:MAG: DNA-binding response regulator [Rhodobacteraceae bacterium]|nr:DNA-binding response regulator [Paracoccaceae bacterium]
MPGDPFDTPHVLIVEDDPEIAAMVAEGLEAAGLQTRIARDGRQMDSQLRQRDFSLIILDIMLPGEDGLSLCRRIRAEKMTPIIMLTALNEEPDRIVGLELGADDYIAKPFSLRELLARVRSLLRRAACAPAPARRTRPLRFEGWRIDPRRRQLHDPANTLVTMTTAEFDLLVVFCTNPGRILARDELLSLTHAGLAGPVERSIDVHVSRIRQRIEPDPKNPVLLKTVRLGGYVFAADVTEG